LPDDTILCWTWPDELRGLLSSPDEKRHVTKKDCVDWLGEGNEGRYKLAEFFRQRMRERYIDLVLKLDKDEKNGFSVMAVSCLLIEAFETFRQGWSSTEKKSRSPLAFCYFFDREKAFHVFKEYAQDFYKHVRCGILHQGETTGGWTVRREGILFDPKCLRVNATEFHILLADAIDDYRKQLRDEPISSDVWQKFKTKMSKTIKNCEAKP
jgi:hypothetical protein